jgi:hypothetical protein
MSKTGPFANVVFNRFNSGHIREIFLFECFYALELVIYQPRDTVDYIYIPKIK